MAQWRNDQLANLYFNPPINGYEQLVIFIMDVVRQTWKNLEEVELVEDTWRKKLVKATGLPHRPNEKYFRLRHIVDKTCFGVKYDRKINPQSAFTIYAPLRCPARDFSALSHIRSIILNQVPDLLKARSKGVEYEAEFLQTEIVKELQKRYFDIPDCLLRYTRHVQELIQQQEGKLILENSDEPDDTPCVSMDALLKPVKAKKEVWKGGFLEIPSKVDGLYRKQCLPKTATEADRKLRLFILYKMLISKKHSGMEIPDEVFPEHEENHMDDDENFMTCQFSKIMNAEGINNNFLNGVLKLGNRNYTFKTCRLRLSHSSHLDLGAAGIHKSSIR